MNNKRTIIFCLLCYSSSHTDTVYADIYLYTDKEGRKHYSDKPNSNAEKYRPKATLQPIPKPQLPKLDIPPSRKTPTNNNHAKQQAKKQRHCAAIDRKIEQLNDKLRRGHSNTEGNRWRDQRRALSDRRYKECR